MKKIFCLLLTAIIILSLSACGKEEKKEKVKLAAVKNDTVSENLKSSDGTVSFKLNISLPQIKLENNERVADVINRIIKDYSNEAVEFANSNIETARDFMKSNSSSEPWTKNISYETTYKDENLICFLVSDKFALDAGSESETLKTYCFDLRNGARYSVEDFTNESTEPFYNHLMPHIIDRLDKGFNKNRLPLTDEQKENLKNNFEPYDFYIDENSVHFYILRSKVEPSELGYFMCDIPYDELSICITRPENILTLD